MPKLGIGIGLSKVQGKRVAVYKATGSGLSPNINGMLLYESGTLNNRVLYASDEGYFLWYFSPINSWCINKTKTIGSSPQWLQSAGQGSSPTNSTYAPAFGITGTVTVVRV